MKLESLGLSVVSFVKYYGFISKTLEEKYE